MSELQWIWFNGRFVKKSEATTAVTTHALHYGTAVFEGIRAYDTPNGTAILALDAHINRLLYSMNALAMMTEYTHQALCQAVIDTVKKNQLKACYIRPLAFYGDTGSVRVLPAADHPVDIVIFCLPMGRYLAADCVDVMTSKYIRIHPDSSVCDAKISGHYVNSMLASMECRGTHYHEALLLDARGNVAEGAAQNIFIVKNKVLITTPLGTILAGVTRKLVMEIAEKNGISVREQYFKPEAVIAADEAFFTGTAAEITPIRSLDDHKIAGHGNIGPVTEEIIKCFKEMTKGADKSPYLTYLDV